MLFGSHPGRWVSLSRAKNARQHFSLSRRSAGEAGRKSGRAGQSISQSSQPGRLRVSPARCLRKGVSSRPCTTNRLSKPVSMGSTSAANARSALGKACRPRQGGQFTSSKCKLPCRSGRISRARRAKSVALRWCRRNGRATRMSSLTILWICIHGVGWPSGVGQEGWVVTRKAGRFTLG